METEKKRYVLKKPFLTGRLCLDGNMLTVLVGSDIITERHTYSAERV